LHGKGSIFIQQALYKTGDLVRYLADGNIEYLGRIDNQVKLRGLRIELGEIQTILDSHPQINQSVVIIQTDSGDNQRLVAYVASQNQALTAKELRQFLQPKLPVYMIPSAFVILPEFPLNANGKVDLKNYPSPMKQLW
jgi:microcystin synthetase protein McyB